MKFLPCFAALLALTLCASAKNGWLEDLDKARTRARTEGKPILLDFTGSDWCGWCQKLEAEVFTTPQWKAYAEKKLVLLRVDFPQGIRQSEALQKQNLLLAKRYGVEGFPTLVLVTPAGVPKGALGYVPGGPSAFIRQVEKAK